MSAFLEHLERIFEYIIRETTSDAVIKVLYEKITHMIESRLVYRDIDNFIAYFKLILSASRIPKRIHLEPKLVKAFVNRTYTGDSDATQDIHANRLYKYLAERMGHRTELNTANLDQLDANLRKERVPILDNIIERVHIAMILKWLQGPLWNRLSQELQDYIVAVATAYGQSQEIPTMHLELHPHQLSSEDRTLIESEYTNFEAALTESLDAIKTARAKHPDPSVCQEQLNVIVSSLDRLVKLGEGGKLDSVEAFKHKILVSTALIYVQDEFVRKDPDLQKNVQLLVQLYYQFRDMRWK